ncbi:MAG: hypothetical protein PHV23_04615 [Candidatus Gracilibacteria bacterium]|nr:hypothetical protein [Candidatus Gracilibacteria bacterium]
MIKKLGLSILIIIVLYILAIFNAPVLADNIEKFIGTDGFNQKIRDFKASLDGIPVQDNLSDIYNKTLSGAEGIGNEAVGKVNDVKNSIDDVRGTLSGAVNTYKEVKNTIDETKTQVENGINSLKNTADTINGVGFSIQNTISGTLNNN